VTRFRKYLINVVSNLSLMVYYFAIDSFLAVGRGLTPSRGWEASAGMTIR